MKEEERRMERSIKSKERGRETKRTVKEERKIEVLFSELKCCSAAHIRPGAATRPKLPACISPPLSASLC